MVECLRFRDVANQSMKVKVCGQVSGNCMLTPVSFWHLSNIVSAVLYVLHVFLATPIFPHFAIDFRILSGRFRLAKEASVQPPTDPYFVLPAKGLGLKPANGEHKLCDAKR